MKNILLTGVFGAVVALVPGVALAANLFITPEDLSFTAGEQKTLAIHVASDTSINTISTALLLPTELTFVSTAEGSVVKNWVERPSYAAEDRSVSFAGIIPNGWRGEGVVLYITLTAKVSGVYAFSFDPARTELYKNDGEATPEPVVFGTVARVSVQALWGVVLLLLIVVVLLLRQRYRVRVI